MKNVYFHTMRHQIKRNTTKTILSAYGKTLDFRKIIKKKKNINFNIFSFNLKGIVIELIPCI